MIENEFWILYNLIQWYYPLHHNKKKRGSSIYIPNKRIDISLRLSIVIRYFAGGSPYDLMLLHSVGHSDMYKSIWYTVDAVNQCPKLSFSFLSCHEKQKEITNQFASKSSIGFDNCVGCIDGLLIWTRKPTKPVLDEAKLGATKLFYGRKKRFRLNMQAICDNKRRFLDVDISHPASTSDYLSFGTSPI